MLGIIIETFSRLSSGKKKSVCVIHEFEVDTITMSFFIVFLVLTYYRTTVGSIMLTSEHVYNPSFKLIL